MALSGSFQNYPVSSFGLYCDWSASQNIAGNYSDVTLWVYLSYYTLSVGSRSDSTISVNGDSVTYTAPAINDYSSGWKKKLLQSKTVRVYHNSDGSKSCSLSASWRFSGTYSGVSIGTITASQTITLNGIDTAAPSVSFSASSVTVNSVYISANASTNCDTWQYSTNGGSSWATFDSGSGTSKGYTISGLSANTSYSLRVRARKTSNQVYGTSGTISIKTLGATVINSVNTVTADSETATIIFSRTIYSASFTHTLNLKNGSTTILSFTGLTGAVATASQTITLSAAQRTTLLNAMASAKSFTGTFELITYNSGSQVGSPTTKTATITTTSSNSAPIFSDSNGFIFEDSYSTTVNITGNNQVLVKGYSTLKVTAYTATPKNGATISSYEVTAAGVIASSSGTVVTVGKIYETGSVSITLKVADSRGYTVTKTKTISVVDYSAIDISDYTLRRINEVDNLTMLNVSGSLSEIKVSGTNKNAFSYMRYRYKKTSDSSYSGWYTLTATASGTAFSYNSDEWVSFDANYSWNIQIIAADKLTTETITFILPQGTPLVTFKRKMVGINNKNPTSSLDVDGDIKMNGQNVQGFIKVMSGEDFNTIIAAGIYHYGTIATNAPSNVIGLLEVLVVNTSYILQRFTEYTAGNKMYIRTKNSNTWTSWVEK